MSKYLDTLDFLYSQLPMYQRVGKSAFKKDLTNIISLSEALDNPHKQLNFIHIGGTNGKGSVTHLIAHVLQSQGFKVGVYTSPHYKDFRERFKINGKYIPKEYIVNFVADNKDIISTIQPSFFEITVGVAFKYFADMQVDYVIMEVGLGGRLDSTNIISPILSVITNISMDHMDMLGDTLPAIAFEKAGIIKPNVPVVIGEYQEEVAEIFLKTAEKHKSSLAFADQHLEIEKHNSSLKLILDENEWLTIPNFPLEGNFQYKNLTTAFYACTKLEEYVDIDWSKVINSFPDFAKLTSYLGRWQFISRKPDILIDSAHNEAGLDFLISFLKDNANYKNLHLVLGFVNDKELNNILTKFPKEATYYFAKANVPRGLNANLLQQKANTVNLQGKAYSSVRKALSIAKRKTDINDLIFVGGSIFVVAEVL